MTYTHLSTDELVMIAAYFHQNIFGLSISKRIDLSYQIIHNMMSFLKQDHTALEYYKQKMWQTSDCVTARPTGIHQDPGYSRLDTRCHHWSCGVSNRLFRPYPFPSVRNEPIRCRAPSDERQTDIWNAEGSRFSYGISLKERQTIRILKKNLVILEETPL